MKNNIANGNISIKNNIAKDEDHSLASIMTEIEEDERLTDATTIMVLIELNRCNRRMERKLSRLSMKDLRKVVIL